MEGINLGMICPRALEVILLEAEELKNQL